MANQQKRSVLITGCSQGGAGNALALEFASKGYRVFATARSQKTLTNLREKGIETLVLDVTNADSIHALAVEIASRTRGHLDMLFNNAGTLYEAPAVEADPSRVRSLFETNVFGLMEMVTAFTPLLLASVTPNHTPTIVNVASILARLPVLFGLRVVTLYMGEVSTPFMATENINFGPDSLYRDVEDSVKARTTTHLEKTMPPTEFARQVVGALINGKDSFLWKGTNAFAVWLLNAVGPRAVFDSTMIKAVGLNKAEARASIFKLGQERANSG
ncbi:hypothetical protein CDV31_014957 [Fusarium ambrosium]|uniref:NADPH-dependent 1-acyldihydroxyacetone phosphate reductase n=1 Tax=Fusarium ambrosium TaxID=131363 RepID=A0A428SSW2_9HYPO|nr:hypothetical protein CDV31_014957 [Fusarium ambrosium]